MSVVSNLYIHIQKYTHKHTLDQNSKLGQSRGPKLILIENLPADIIEKLDIYVDKNRFGFNMNI